MVQRDFRLTSVVEQHCLVAIRRPASSTAPPRLPSWFNRGLDTQVLLAEVRETSRKPDELYDMIERILGGKGKGRKVELFGREHNLRDGWCVLVPHLFSDIELMSVFALSGGRSATSSATATKSLSQTSLPISQIRASITRYAVS